MLAIKGGKILTITDGVIEGGTILIDGGKIVKVGKRIKVPEDAEVIDVTGKVVRPGLIDAHCHIGIIEEKIGWAGGSFGVLVGGLVIYLGAVRYRDCKIGGSEPLRDLLEATWGERLFAYLIDLVVLSVLVSWMSWPGCEWIPHSVGSGIPRWVPYSDFGFRNMIYFLYWSLLEGIYGQSVGKRLRVPFK